MLLNSLNGNSLVDVALAIIKGNEAINMAFAGVGNPVKKSD